MSMPNIPDINPDIKLARTDVINLLLASIGLEEISLSHILNAEAEKIKSAVDDCCCVHDLLALNESVESMVRTIVQKEMVLLFKLESVLKIPEHPIHPPCGCDCDGGGGGKCRCHGS